jgi:hypothetical protein
VSAMRRNMFFSAAFTHGHNDKVDSPSNSLVHDGDIFVVHADQRFGEDDIVVVNRRSIGERVSVLVVLAQALCFLVDDGSLHGE